jgi:putative phosphoesterase
VITVISDTHGRSDHRLADHTAAAVREADLVIHAGDFTTEEVFEAFAAEAAELRAVRGNNDSRELEARLPTTRVIDLAGEGFDSETRIALCHGHEHEGTALSLFGRQENASLVVSGHSHRPGVTDIGELTLLNPGSHADPRWNRPAHAELDVGGAGGLDGRLRDPDGTVLEEFRVSPTGE